LRDLFNVKFEVFRDLVRGKVSRYLFGEGLEGDKVTKYLFGEGLEGG
jgi:hypothetical protein